MTLRDMAATVSDPAPQSRIGQLIAKLDAKQAAEVDDLLFGEPRIEHTVAAKVLCTAFADLIDKPISDKQVADYRGSARRS